MKKIRYIFYRKRCGQTEVQKGPTQILKALILSFSSVLCNLLDLDCAPFVTLRYENICHFSKGIPDFYRKYLNCVIIWQLIQTGSLVI